MRRVVVIGAGVAGTAAALAASRGGARVTLVNGGTGASVLAGGALDDVPWETIAGEAPATLEEGARYVLDALDAYAVDDVRALVASTTGVVRPARGVDRALLDLGSLANATIAVPDFAHGSWDARAMARAWSASKLAETRGLRFVSVAASLLARTEEHAMGDAELASRHDDDARLAWLAERIRGLRASAHEDVGAVILPSWLGVTRERATTLSASVGRPCGEVLGGVGGPSGLRFECARDRALAKAGATVAHTWAARATVASDGTWYVETARRSSDTSISCDAVVLATGGLLGGGLEYTPSGASFAGALPDEPRPILRATVATPAQIGVFGRPLDDPSSLFGSAPESHAWPYSKRPTLDHAGVLIDGSGRATSAPRGLFATGEVAAGPAHTWLAALAHGARVGTAAALPTDTGVPRRIS